MRRFVTVCVCVIGSFIVKAQDNSPYSRYGMGDIVPNTSATNRAMGGISAGYNSYYNINYSNPASYSFFQSISEPDTKKQAQGRAILNIGIDGQGRTLIDKNAQSRFTSTNLIFNNVMLGVPLRKNWGMALGLRPINSINYKIINTEPRYDAETGRFIDSSQTQYEGTGGVYLASIGTGVKFKVAESQFISLGINGGYMFGTKDYSSHVFLSNDSTIYASGNWQTKTGIGGLYFDAGLQYQAKLNDRIYLGIGAYGNWQQRINTKTDQIAGTYFYDPSQGNQSIDTAYETHNIKGSIIYPTSFTAGFVIQKPQTATASGWLVGIDFTKSGWNNFRMNDIPDTAIASNWQVKVGAEFSPQSKKKYFSHAYYRLGFFTGPDYIQIRGQTLPIIGISGGVGLPLVNYNNSSSGQATMLNLGFEYLKRGNNQNLLQENMYRVSVGFSLTDIWLTKRWRNLD